MVEAGDDLRPILDSWAYEEGRTIRRVLTPNGREVLQVRLPLGIEQYELHGRPDGKRPEGSESWLHHYREIAESMPHEFELDEEAFDRLREESLLYYSRYLVFFQISEYRLCARDTLRNLELLDFTVRYGTDEMKHSLDQYRPYILRMHVMARALDLVQEGGDVAEALRLLDDGIQRVEEMEGPADRSVFSVEKDRSLSSLRDLYRQLESHLPRPPRLILEEQLQRAIRDENYEEAARIRDAIASLPAERSADSGQLRREE